MHGNTIRVWKALTTRIPSIRIVLGGTLELVTIGEDAPAVYLLYPTLQEHLRANPTLCETTVLNR